MYVTWGLFLSSYNGDKTLSSFPHMLQLLTLAAQGTFSSFPRNPSAKYDGYISLQRKTIYLIWATREKGFVKKNSTSISRSTGKDDPTHAQAPNSVVEGVVGCRSIGWQRMSIWSIVETIYDCQAHSSRHGPPGQIKKLHVKEGCDSLFSQRSRLAMKLPKTSCVQN